jgi:hypothetical protein
MTTRAQVVQARDAHAAVGQKLERLALSTEDASQLAAEMDSEDLRHPEAVAVGVAALIEVGETAPPSGDSERSMRFFEQLSKAADKFWDAFEGQVVEGVEIVRRRA